MDFEKRHALYTKFLPRWNTYLASYLGGDDYRLPSLNMLRKYINEDMAPGDQYGQRLEHTALDNLSRLTVDTFRSFLFKDVPVRSFGSMAGNELVSRFVTDIDFDEQDLDDFMKGANDMAMIYGHVWILVTKGYQDGVTTLEQELAADVRPYAKLFTPENVVDWEYKKLTNGSEVLVRLVTCEYVDDETDRFTEWTPEEIRVYEVGTDGHTQLVKSEEIIVNSIGEIPFIMLKANNIGGKDYGHSDIADVCSIQKAIFNMFSEAEQGIRISNHPTLVKPATVDAQAGAGSVIGLDDNSDPGLNPYLLEPSGTNIQSIVSMIEVHIDAFLRQTHLTSVLTTKGSSPMSGVALQTEFQQLNMRLADKAARLEAAEWSVWRLFFKYAGIQMPVDFNIEYMRSFDIRDQAADLAMYTSVLQMPITSDTYKKEIMKQIAKLTIEDGDALQQVLDEIDASNPGVNQFDA